MRILPPNLVTLTNIVLGLIVLVALVLTGCPEKCSEQCRGAGVQSSLQVGNATNCTCYPPQVSPAPVSK